MKYYETTSTIKGFGSSVSETVTAASEKSVPQARNAKSRRVLKDGDHIHEIRELTEMQTPISELTIREFLEMRNEVALIKDLTLVEVAYKVSHSITQRLPFVLTDDESIKDALIEKTFGYFDPNNPAHAITEVTPITLQQIKLSEVSVAEYKKILLRVKNMDAGGRPTHYEVTQGIESTIQETTTDYKDRFGFRSDRKINEDSNKEFVNDVIQQLFRQFPGEPFIADRLDNYDYAGNYPEPFEHDHELPEHGWIRYKDAFFDAETPTGVNHWTELPFYVRLAEKRRAEYRNS